MHPLQMTQEALACHEKKRKNDEQKKRLKSELVTGTRNLLFFGVVVLLALIQSAVTGQAPINHQFYLPAQLVSR